MIRIIGESDTTNTNPDEDNTETKPQLNNWSTMGGGGGTSNFSVIPERVPVN